MHTASVISTDCVEQHTIVWIKSLQHQ